MSPWRSGDDEFSTFESKEKEYQDINNKVQAAKTICCVGTGPTSLEVAGYLKEAYPDKDVSVCCRGNTVLAKFPGAHDVAVKVLAKAGVNVLTGHPY